ncbi:AcrVA2 family anti-CRISPR protein [Testudinibacter sp. P80/BLE/0925]
MRQDKKHPTIRHLKQLLNRYPKLAEQSDLIRQLHKESVCFIPMNAYQSIYLNETSSLPEMLALMTDISKMGALIPWSYSKLIYRFDDEAALEIMQTEMDSIIPISVFYRLPAWSIYVETPPIDFENGQKINGFYAHLDAGNPDNPGYESDELRLLLDTTGGLVALPLPLKETTVKGLIDGLISSAKVQASKVHIFDDVSPDDNWSSIMLTYIKPVLSLLIFICTQNDEVTERKPVKQAYKRNGYVINPDPIINDVGVRIGSAIKLSKQQAEAKEREYTSTGRLAPRPHIRRAHWHGFWSGSKKDDKQKFNLKWLPPIPVGTDDTDKITPTAHKIKK